MLDVVRLQQDVAAALAAPLSVEWLLAAKRELGLRFRVVIHKDQSIADVAAAFAALSGHFQVEPMFPSPPFEAPVPGQEPTWLELTFVAAIRGVAFDDVAAHPWDIAHAARTNGKLAEVTPDVPVVAPDALHEPPAAPPADEPTRGWEVATMRLEGAWKTIDKTGRGRGGRVDIGHPDTGWWHHPHWGPDKPNLNLRWERNFLRGEEPNRAHDRFGGSSKGHGTATASVMVGRRGSPVNSVARDARVVPIRCTTFVLLFGGIELEKSIVYAQQIGCQVISISLGGYGLNAGVRQALQRAVAMNVIVVAAAGQNPINELPGVRTAEPAQYPECLAIAGVKFDKNRTPADEQYERWNSSNRWDPNDPFGRIAISAPAYQVYRAEANIPADPLYGYSYGTSFATALMAGVAALWISHHFPAFPVPRYQGRIPAQECFRNHLQAKARKRSDFDPWFHGMVDVQAMIDTKPDTNPRDLAPTEAVDLSPTATIAGLLGNERARSLLDSVLPRTAQSDREAWAAEIVHILQVDRELTASLSTKLAASTLTAGEFRDLLAPAASQALRQHLLIEVSPP